jgi:hypothetical protein
VGDQFPHYRYVNDFMYFVFKPHKSGTARTSLYCSGVNISRFLPITKGRHRLGQNPAEKALQLVNLGVRHLVLSSGGAPMTAKGEDCLGIVASKDLWCTEPLLLTDVPESSLVDILNYCPGRLLQHILEACMLDVRVPEEPMKPAECQSFIERLCRDYGT